MSLHEYETSRQLEAEDVPFFALIMAAMRKADDGNLKVLREAFPDTWSELYARYHAPGGVLPTDPVVETPVCCCESPDTNPALISMCCPVHNLNPAAPGCKCQGGRR